MFWNKVFQKRLQSLGMWCSVVKLKGMVQIPAYSLKALVVCMKLHNVAFQNIVILILTVMRTSTVISKCLFSIDFLCFLFMHIWAFQVISFLRVSWPQFCKYFSCLPCLPHDMPISFSWFDDPNKIMYRYYEECRFCCFSCPFKTCSHNWFDRL